MEGGRYTWKISKLFSMLEEISAMGRKNSSGEGALVKELLGKQQDVQVVGFLWGTVLLKLKIQRQNANPHR